MLSAEILSIATFFSNFFVGFITFHLQDTFAEFKVSWSITFVFMKSAIHLSLRPKKQYLRALSGPIVAPLLSR